MVFSVGAVFAETSRLSQFFGHCLARPSMAACSTAAEYSADVVGAQKPLLDAAPDVRIYQGA